MTPAAEWATYVETLLATDQDAAVHEVASRADAFGRTPECAAYLDRVLAQNVEKSRVYEISWDLLTLMNGAQS